MKKPIIALLTLALCGCGAQNAAPANTPAPTPTDTPAEQTSLTVFAAASLKESLTEIADAYQKENKGVEISFNFDSSGTLKTQIEQGEECDVFISAAPKQMNGLDAKSEGGADFINSDSRVDLLENKVVLSVPEGNPKGINTFDELAVKLKEGNILLAIGNSDVPVGQYTQKIFAYYQLDEQAIAQSLTYGTNVKEVTAQVQQASADAGIIYATDAYSAGLKSVDTATPEMCGQVIYPAATLKNSKSADKAQAFLDYLKGDTAKAAFEKVGFTPLG